MNHPRKLFGLWIILTTLFIAIAIILASFFMARYFFRLEAESRQAYKQLVQAQVLKSYQAMAEEAYLKLGAIELHEKDLREILGNKGTVDLTFFEDQAPNSGSSADGVIKPTWLSENADTDSFTVPLFFGDYFIGTLEGVIQWKVDRVGLISGLSGLIIAMLASWILISAIIRRRIFTPLLNGFITLQRSHAVAEMAQMITHDIRRPLTIAKLLGESMGKVRNLSELQSTLKTMLPELDRAVLHADGMIADVMEMGKDTALQLQTVEVETVIDNALTDVFASRSKAEITIDYQLVHTMALSIDALKISRVFCNIIVNALEAMDDTGRIWFHTEDKPSGSDSFIEIRIGNSGSYISPEDRAVLFEPFFTKGKKSGTGLGLAIAKKIVRAHRGHITCHSSEELGVEFVFTLPADRAVKAQSRLVLLKSGKEYRQRFHAKIKESQSAQELLQPEDGLENEFLQLANETGKIRLLMVDDEEIYRQAVYQLIHPSRLTEKVEVLMASDFDEAQAQLSLHPHICITDIDLGRHSKTGFELIRKIRATGSQAEICVLSNRFLPGDSKMALDFGANAFLPKPMTRSHLLKVLINGAKAILAQRQSSSSGLKRPDGILIDNDELIRTAWELRAHSLGMTLMTFSSAEEFLKIAATIDRCTPIYVDSFLDDGERGEALAQKLHEDGFTHLYLATGASAATFGSMPWIRGVIGKEPPF